MFATKDGKFVKDEGYDFKRSSSKWQIYAATPLEVCKDGKLLNEDIDVSDIPPTIILACIVNTYACGFSICVGLDISLEQFSKQVAEDFTTLSEKNSFPNSAPVCHYFWSLILKCDKTSKLNTVEWNQIAHHSGLIWNIGQGPNLDEPPIISHGSLQGIIEAAQKVVISYSNAKIPALD